MIARPPCPSCPWRVDAHADEIPGFDLGLAERLDRTCSPDMVEYPMPMFACHHSKPGAEITCAGWIAAVGADAISVRLGVMSGTITPDQLHPGSDWPELHSSFGELITKLRDDCA